MTITSVRRELAQRRLDQAPLFARLRADRDECERRLLRAKDLSWRWYYRKKIKEIDKLIAELDDYEFDTAERIRAAG